MDDTCPMPVARFQQLCGVKWQQPDPQNPLFPLRKLSASKKTSGNSAEHSFQVSYPFIRFLAKAGSELAGEPFYYAFGLACSILFDIIVGRRALIMLTITMYIGQSLKDILKRPRPATPPVVRLDSMYECEYGMPSTHTMTGIASSFSLLVFSSEEHPMQVSLGTGVLLASMWSSAIMISRIYLGMHTILEITAGAMLSFLLLLLHPIVEWFDELHINSSPSMSISIFVGSLVLAKIMFMLDNDVDQSSGMRRWNTAPGDTAKILGLCSGFLIGTKYSLPKYISRSSSSDIPYFTETGCFLMFCLLRLIVGVLLVAPLMHFLKKVVLHASIRINGFSNADVIAAKRDCSVELSYKFFTPFLSAMTITATAPVVLQYFQLW